MIRIKRAYEAAARPGPERGYWLIAFGRAE